MPRKFVRLARPGAAAAQSGSFNRKTGKCKRPGNVTPQMMSSAVAAARIELRGAGLDDSPQCCKKFPDVLESPLLQAFAFYTR
jgi:hypothetical protein